MKTLRLHILTSALIAFVLGCATSSGLRKADIVTLVLNDGENIEAQIDEINRDKVTFRAKSVKQAYKYGEALPPEKIRGIKLQDGRVLTLAEYKAYRNSKSSPQEERTTRQPTATAKKRRPEAAPAAAMALSPEQQYAQLKSKPISEMSDNEFEFFMLMMKKELEAQEWAESQNPKTADKQEVASEREALMRAVESLSRERSAPSAQANQPPQRGPDLQQAVDSMVDAGLAARYLSYLVSKSRSGFELSPAEKEMRDLIQASPKWRERVEELNYLNRTAKKIIGRVYLFNPEELQTKLNLKFDQDLEMDYPDLLSQLHRSLGADVKISDYRTLVDVFGESGGRTVKEVLERYSEMEFVLSNPEWMANK